MMSSLALVFVLQSGLYHCPADPNICDQDVSVHTTNGQVDALKVEYVGWCGSMGPYPYFCDGNTCRDENAEFEILGPNLYHWKNLGHPYQCNFELKPTRS